MLIAVLALGCGCGDAGSGDAGVDAGPGHAVDPSLFACAAQQEPVATIEAMVTHLNALPHPVSVACAIASFQRPLQVVATSSFVSAQPASGAKDPRVFVLEPGLVLSVASGGPGQHLLEFGEWVTPLRTLKAEIGLPLDGALALSGPFSRVKFEADNTSCSLCHRNEQPSTSVDGGYVSTAYRPVSDSVVGLEVLRAQHEACIGNPDGGERCDHFHALFDFGAIVQGAFDPSVEVFVQ